MSSERLKKIETKIEKVLAKLEIKRNEAKLLAIDLAELQEEAETIKKSKKIACNGGDSQ